MPTLHTLYPAASTLPGGRLNVPWVGQGQMMRRRVRTGPGAILLRDTDNSWRQIPFASASEVPMSEFNPVRQPSVHNRRRTVAGWFYSVTMDDLLPSESANERDVGLVIDFEADVTAIVTQPFFVGDDEPNSDMCPDLLVERKDGERSVIDVKPQAELDEPGVARRLERMRRVCEEIGWPHEVRCEPDPTFLRNLRFLHAAPLSERDEPLARRILDRAQSGCAFSALFALGSEPLVRGCALTLIRRHRLGCDLREPLSNRSWVWSTIAGEP
jgi:hypothetical protein